MNVFNLVFESNIIPKKGATPRPDVWIGEVFSIWTIPEKELPQFLISELCARHIIEPHDIEVHVVG